MRKPTHSEDEYIARQEALERHKAAVKKRRAMAAEEAERARKLHHMKCPKCGMDLETVVFRGVSIDKCYHCNGTWLDAGELEILAGQGSGALESVAELFRREGPIGGGEPF